MDIKLKNNKSIGLLIAGIITALFAAGFMALYPSFEEKAQEYQLDGLQGEELLHGMYCSNYVLYKDIMEKVNQTKYSYADLYLDKEELKLEELKIGDSNYVEEGFDSFIADVETATETAMQNWESLMRYELAEAMDYCVIDNATGEMIKNTGRKIETLIKSGEDAPEGDADYVYYVAVSYDNAGNLEQAMVRGTESDALLKSVQRVLAGNFDENRYGSGNEYLTNGWGIFYGYSEREQSEKSVEYQLGAPKDVTFIYAMTKEQRTAMLQDGILGSNMNEWHAYCYAGVGEVYRIFLLIIAVVIFLVMNYKKYDLHRSKKVRIPLEAGIVLIVVIMAVLSNSVVGLVSDTNRGYFPIKYEQYVPFLPVAIYPVLTVLINFGFLSLLFGGWIYAVNSLGEIFVLGLKGFLKERSILLKWWMKLCQVMKRFWDFCKQKYRNLKEELLHANLGEETNKTLRRIVIINFVVLAIMCSMWVFGWFTLLIYSVGVYWALKRYIRRIQEQYRKLLKSTESIADGKLNTTFDEDLGVFESYKEALYKIQQGFSKAVDEEVKSQRMKTELITNVSHDLKTPLTAITTYVDLLKAENITKEQQKEYIAVLEKKSLRLKTLIEDLFEVSKANSRNVTMHPVDVDICNLLRQVYLEYEDRVEDANLIFRFRMPEEKITLSLDSQKTYRIFENLYTNIIKYAMAGSRVYVDVEQEEKGVRIELKNMSAIELRVEAEELTERFVRGDSSRNTEGSGLGLAIAKSFVELQGGKLEICVDGDLFKVTIWFVE